MGKIGYYPRHYEEEIRLNADAQSLFSYADDHANFASHMSGSSWMMGGGKMLTQMDEGQGREVGSHIKMSGRAFGANLFLDEVVTIRNPPYRKEWQTVGDLNLLVIDHYKLGFEIEPVDGGSRLIVHIWYGLPESLKTRWLGYLFGKKYAKWCVREMINAVKTRFAHRRIK